MSPLDMAFKPGTVARTSNPSVLKWAARLRPALDYIAHYVAHTSSQSRKSTVAAISRLWIYYKLNCTGTQKTLGDLSEIIKRAKHPVWTASTGAVRPDLQALESYTCSNNATEGQSQYFCNYFFRFKQKKKASCENMWCLITVWKCLKIIGIHMCYYYRTYIRTRDSLPSLCCIRF